MRIFAGVGNGVLLRKENCGQSRSLPRNFGNIGGIRCVLERRELLGSLGYLHF